MHLVCPGCGATNRVPDERLSESPVCGRCKTALMPHEPVALSDRIFPAFIAGTELPVVVDFWADWCGPCKMMAPQFAQAAKTLTQVRFAKVDTEAAPHVSARYAIRSIPTLILFDHSKEVARRAGAVGAAELIAWINQHTGSASR